MQRFYALGLTGFLFFVSLCCTSYTGVRSPYPAPEPEFYKQAERITRHYVHRWVTEKMADSPRLHDKVSMMRLPTVRWVNNRCPDSKHESPVIVYRDECYGGLMFTWDRIYVAVSNSHRAGPTSFVHEMAHAWRKVLYDDYDTHHVQTEWWSYFLDEIRPAVTVAEMTYFK